MSLVLKDINFKYKQQENLLFDGLSLSCKMGECTALLGESGCGKSTVMKLISGLEKPSKGEISFCDELWYSKTVSMKPKQRSLSVVFHDVAFFPHLSLLENILILKNKRKDSEEFIKTWSEKFKIADILNKKTLDVSGGQKMRAALLRGMISKSKVLVCDEPFAHLDKDLRDLICAEMTQFIKKEKKCFVWITHDQERASKFADQLVFINSER